MSQAQPRDLFETRMASAGSEGTAGIEFDGQTGTYRVTAYGADAPGSGDPMPTAWTSLKGDFILRVHLAFEGPTPDPMDRMGLVIREEPRKEAAYVSGTVSGAGRAFLETPPARDEPALTESPAAGIPDVLQIERRGDLFIVSSARDGQPWVHQERTIELDNYVFAGLFVEAARPGRNLTARFWNVRLIKPEPPQQEAYRDYLGSRLEILDTKTGLRRVVLESTHSIQAPNWTPDGKTLIYNSHGYLYTYDLESGSVGMLNTGFANRNNNDHVLSADGHFLAISHHNEADNGASSIYYLPVSGSVEPVKVTRDGVGPSYLHGWSADRSTMLFTGARNGQYDIYAVDVATGEETQLTDEPGLDDGSEYSPDGRWIYFNSNRTGTMQLWRMRPDGGEPEQLTFDPYQDWFPHPSPDGEWLVMISYPKEVPSGEHPFYKHCMLRILPAEGGTLRAIAYIYGGQGSINVPSWSPDGRYLAFVSNSD